MIFRKGLIATISSLVFTCVTISYADDTDIFLSNPNYDSGVKPNVLFVLDNSGSMGWTLDGDKSPSPNEETRLDILQNSLSDILTNASNINVGLMKFNPRTGENGRLTFPVTNIDKPYNSNQILDGSPEIITSADDAVEELNSHRVSNNSRVLIMGTTSDFDGPANFMTGLRFQNVGIPQGSTIQTAKVEFTAADNDSDIASFNVWAGRPGSTHNDPFTSTASNLSARAKYGPSTWTTTPWVQGSDDSPNTYSTEVSSLLQQVVSDSGWCGNDSATFYFERKSGAGLRSAFSIDGDKGSKARLIIEYTPPVNGGCNNLIISQRIQSSDYDAHQGEKGSKSDTVDINDNDLDFYGYSSKTRSRVGLNYSNLPLKKNAKILAAHLEFTAYEDSDEDDKDDQMSVFIYGEDSGSTKSFIAEKGNISKRKKTATSIKWSIDEEWYEDTGYSSPDISSLIETIVSRDDWLPGNNLGLILEFRDGRRKVISYDKNPSYSPRLRIKVAASDVETDNTYKVRDHLLALINTMEADDGTPIVPAQYDGARYFKDGLYNQPSPINNTCQSNHLVLLTDGEATENNVVSDVERLINQNQCQSTSIDDEECGRELSRWLASTDLKPSIDRDNTVTTHTIAFAAKSTAQTFMQDLASEGSGGYYTAENAQDLSSAFNNIVNNILDNESTFSAPGVAANSFNRSEHLNKVYYSIFKPSLTDRWSGNLKKYQLLMQGNELKLHDASDPAQVAIDDSGFFTKETLSFWGSEVDGRDIEKGGAREHIPSDRNMFTFTGVNPAGIGQELKAAANQLIANNLSPTLFGLESGDTTKMNELITWIRDPATGLGDPLHSTPTLVNFKCTQDYSADSPLSCPEEKQQLTLFFGTNDGLLHAINAQTGSEIFSFMPKELLPNLTPLKDNRSTNRTPGNGRPYGLDGHIVVWANDLNKNGVIYGGADSLDSDSDGSTLDELSTTSPNPDEFVYAYAGMRRGGRNYYALDVTDTTNPKMLWYLKGGEGDFTRLGQTWSRPVRTKIRMGATLTDVLIFSGGYDADEDNDPLYRAGNMGNAIYIVDAKTGALIWSGSSAYKDDNSNKTIELSKMTYSIPGGVTVTDMEGDGIADQLFFGDTGGQVWRLFINNCKPGENDDISVCEVKNRTDTRKLIKNNEGSSGVIAHTGYLNGNNISDLEKRQNARKFFSRPDVTTVTVNGKTNLAVSIGSGTRPDPLGLINSDVQDQFYTILRPNLYSPKSSYIVSASILSNKTPDSLSTSTETNSWGWYINMAPTEKVMSDAAIYQSKIYFNTYIPSNEVTDGCSAVQGQARAWEINLNGSLSRPPENIKSNGIVGNSVFIRTRRMTYDSGGNLIDSGIVEGIGRGTDWSELDNPMGEGSTYWIQNK